MGGNSENKLKIGPDNGEKQWGQTCMYELSQNICKNKQQHAQIYIIRKLWVSTAFT